VLGVPSNDFGGQEPGTEAKIKEFCEVNFNVDFPMTTKVHVRGDGAHPFYRWAAEELGSATKPRCIFSQVSDCARRPASRLVRDFDLTDL